MRKCAKCGEEASNQNDRYFVIPGYIIAPNCYYLCENHKGLPLSFEDFYNEDGTRKRDNGLWANDTTVVRDKE